MRFGKTGFSWQTAAPEPKREAGLNIVWWQSWCDTEGTFCLRMCSIQMLKSQIMNINEDMMSIKKSGWKKKKTQTQNNAVMKKISMKIQHSQGDETVDYEHNSKMGENWNADGITTHCHLLTGHGKYTQPQRSRRNGSSNVTTNIGHTQVIIL